ncbi:hypothetical protein RvY_18031 [Ramazzottius varieornatus]|uniref:Lsm14-like N-terminal domain-containing protein n=1 Tax=Ramazzottius varieornatus TaxID=947166 RepID=A0A1D1W7V6_RAMVA|nr:hypothetical protein RvY_18031 [Ramazzottius varieornatus]
MDSSMNKTPMEAMGLEQVTHHGNGTPGKQLVDRRSIESGYSTNHGSASEATNSETKETAPVASPPPRLAQTINILTGYIGKRISVISRSDLRYEGMLQTVDQSTESATMNKVRCYGTESRPTETRIEPRDELYDFVKFRLPELKDIFAHVEQAREMMADSSVVECSTAVTPILWSSLNEDYASGFTVPDGRAFADVDNMTAEEWTMLVVDKDSAVSLLQQHVGSRNKISIISKALIRYEGLLRHLDIDTHQISLVCVKFLGTEERPVAKKVDARTETYTSVKFQLGEARDVRVYVKMPDEMANDHAVIVSESSLGTIYALKKRLPAPTNGDATNVQMDTINGNVRLRMDALSPRRSGDGRGIVIPVPQGLLPISPKKDTTPGRRSRLFDTDTRKSAQKTQPADDYQFRGEEEDEAEEEEESGDEEVADDKQAATTINSRLSRGGGGRARAASNGKRGRGSRSKSGKRQRNTKSQKRQQLDVPAASSEGTSEGAAAEDGVPKVKKMQLDALISNTMGSHSPAVYPDGNGDKMGEDVSSEEGTLKGPEQVLPIPWGDALKKFRCPIQPCPDDYEARNVYQFQTHFTRSHPELNARLVLQCAVCKETIQSNSLPDLTKHQIKAHGPAYQQNGELNGQTAEHKAE